MEGIPPIEPFLIRLDTLSKKMEEPDFYSDQRAASAVSREHQHLSKLRDAYKKLENVFIFHKDASVAVWRSYFVFLVFDVYFYSITDLQVRIVAEFIQRNDTV